MQTEMEMTRDSSHSIGNPACPAVYGGACPVASHNPEAEALGGGNALGHPFIPGPDGYATYCWHPCNEDGRDDAAEFGAAVGRCGWEPTDHSANAMSILLPCTNEDASCDPGTMHRFPSEGGLVRVKRDGTLPMVGDHRAHTVSAHAIGVVTHVLEEAHQVAIAINGAIVWADIEDDIELLDWLN